MIFCCMCFKMGRVEALLEHKLSHAGGSVRNSDCLLLVLDQFWSHETAQRHPGGM